MREKQVLDLVLKGLNAGRWEWNIAKGQETWSDTFYQVLGYEPGEFEADSTKFIDSHFHPEHREFVLQKINRHLIHREDYDVEVRILTKDNGYRWFRSMGIAHFEEDKPIYMVGAIMDIHKRKEQQMELEHLLLVQEEVAKMANIGNWELDLETLTPTWSDEVFRIHEVPVGAKVSVEQAQQFFSPEYRDLLNMAIEKAAKEGQPFDLNLELTTAKGNTRWVRSIGSPVKDNVGATKLLRGSFQDISEEIRKVNESEQKTELLVRQNNRLQNFTYIVSHNLRNQAAGLKGITDLLKQPDLSPTEQKELVETLGGLSKNLSTTIDSLGELVAIQNTDSKSHEDLLFQEVFDGVQSALGEEIKSTQSQIELDFQVEKVAYIRAYLESIFTNMMSNAMKYRHPDRHPHIQIKSEAREEGICLSFTDNGLGIDLEKYGDKLFSMYQTFHQNDNSTGVGLYITKNQVESQGGSISVESEPGMGTTFYILFKDKA